MKKLFIIISLFACIQAFGQPKKTYKVLTVSDSLKLTDTTVVINLQAAVGTVDRAERADTAEYLEPQDTIKTNVLEATLIQKPILNFRTTENSNNVFMQLFETELAEQFYTQVKDGADSSYLVQQKDKFVFYFNGDSVLGIYPDSATVYKTLNADDITFSQGSANEVQMSDGSGGFKDANTISAGSQWYWNGTDMYLQTATNDYLQFRNTFLQAYNNTTNGYLDIGLGFDDSFTYDLYGSSGNNATFFVGPSSWTLINDFDTYGDFSFIFGNRNLAGQGGRLEFLSQDATNGNNFELEVLTESTRSFNYSMYDTDQGVTSTDGFYLDTTKYGIIFDQDTVVKISKDSAYFNKNIKLDNSVTITEPTDVINKSYADATFAAVKENNISVAKSGGLYTTIADAINSITDSDSLNRYSISVYPGIYEENNPITLPPYVSLISNGGIGTALIKGNNSGPILKLDSVNLVQGFTFANSDKAIQIDSAGAYQINNVIFNSLDTGICINNPLALAFITDVNLVGGNKKIDKGFHISAGNVTVNDIKLISTDSIARMVCVSSPRSTVTINNLLTFSPNVDTVVFANDSANVLINTSSIVNAKNGLIADSTAQIIFNGNSHFRISGTYTNQENGAIVGGYANNDDNDDAVIFEGLEVHIGDAANPFEVCVGGGDSYSDDLLAYMYNGTIYWSLGDSLKDIDNIGVSYPNVNENTALYIASDVGGDSIKHYGLKVSIIDSMTVNGGEVIAEYWDGTDWNEFNCMVTDSDAPFAPRAKEYFEQPTSTQIRYNIDMTNDDWTANDPMSLGTNKRWVRFRIAAVITESFTIDQIKLHTERFEINGDGFVELFGNARNNQVLQFGIGSGQPFEGNMQSQTIYVDENIGVGYQNNTFTATGDKLGYSVRFPGNIDTGCPIKLIWSGRYVTGGTAEWTIRYYILQPGGTLSTSEPAASGDAFEEIFDQTVTAGINEIFSVDMDVSTAFPTRSGGFGDQLWISLQPTTLPGNFSLTNIGAAYWTWSEGGHY